MLESLPLTIRTELELIRRQNSDRGALKFLPSLFDLILNDKKLKMLIFDFEEKTLEKQKAEENEKQKAIEWITEKAKKLNTHPLADHFFIKPVIQQLDRTLNLEDIRCGQSYISSLMKDLKEVVCLLANFGTHEIFEGWAPIEIKTDQIVLYDLSLPVTRKITKISLQSKLGEQLIKSRKQGFIHASIIPISNQPGIQKSPIEMEYGWIDEFKVPEFLKLSYEYDNSKNVTVCMATLKSDPVLLYEHLKLLTQNWRVKTLFLPSEKSLTRWQEIDALNTQTKNWFYLNTPKSEKKEPLDHNKIIDLVETFLLMITRFYPECDLDQKKVEQQLKSGPKNKARIPYEGSDEQNFCDWYKGWKKEIVALPPYQKNQKMAIKAFRKQTRIKLKSEYKDSTYLRWMTRHNNRSKSKK